LQFELAVAFAKSDKGGGTFNEKEGGLKNTVSKVGKNAVHGLELKSLRCVTKAACGRRKGEKISSKGLKASGERTGAG